jgi:hypothetical protein
MSASKLIIFATLALALAACSDDGYDEHRTLYAVSSQAVQASGVELTFESCSRPQQCDFLFQIANNSDRCVAFSEVSLPGRDYVWLDTTFNALPRIVGNPDGRVRRSFVVLPPRESIRQGVDLRAITGLRDLGNSRITMTTRFFECTAFTGAQAESFELVSAPITFTAVP